MPRVLIGLSEVAGFYSGLKSGLELNGCSVTFINLSEHPFGFCDDDPIWPVGIIKKVDTQRRLKSGILFLVFCLLQYGLQSILFFRLVFKHDYFIFCANRSFMGFLDVFLIRALGKKVIYQMHGSDARPPYLDGSLSKGSLFSPKAIKQRVLLKKCILRVTEFASNEVVNIPPQAQFFTKPYVNSLQVGITVRADIEKFLSIKANEKIVNRDFVRVIHCPSRKLAKGAEDIIAVVNQLISEGYNIEFKVISGAKNDAVLGEIARADLVIDQLYSDYAMPGLATECAWLRTPVILSGYASDHWPRWQNETPLPPTVYCRVGEFKDSLISLVESKELRNQVAQEMFDFVSTYWSPAKVASNYLALFEEKFEGPRLDPRLCDYFMGCCIDSKRLKLGLADYVSVYGVKGLGLMDKPKLQKKIMDFIK